MRLADVFRDVDIISSSVLPETEVFGLVFDSRKVKKGDVFVAVAGLEGSDHGIKYAKAAIEAGASCILCDVDPPEYMLHIRVKNARAAAALAAAALAGYPARRLSLIGVTGTNGKTTVTHLIRDILEKNGKSCGLIGTNEVLIKGGTLESPGTTPEAPELHEIFAKIADSGCEYCVMEVSSHALSLHRIDGLSFEAAAFTNLSRDHLNFHKTMEDYAAAKALLFPMAKASVINIDDPYGQEMSRAAGKQLTYSIKDNSADLMAKNIRYSPAAVDFEALTTGSIKRMHLGIPGEFSVMNALAAIGVCLTLGLGFDEIFPGLASAQGVMGRAEIVPVDRDFTVMIDYAHSPDSLQNILKAVRPFTPGKVITVFGCGGERDRTKRPIMGKIAEDMSDFAVVTSDNPRREVPEEIIGEILAGMRKKNHIAITDRTEAIGHALKMAGKGDLVLIAGKGHELYQDIGGKIIHYNEREIIRNHLSLGAENNGSDT